MWVVVVVVKEGLWLSNWQVWSATEDSAKRWQQAGGGRERERGCILGGTSRSLLLKLLLSATWRGTAMVACCSDTCMP